MNARKNLLTLSMAFLMILGNLLAGGLANAAAIADSVVYGTIYTANNQAVMEAMAIKDGRFIYVGDKAGAAAYIGKDTKIINHENGMIMPGGVEAHGHYLFESAEKMMIGTKAETFAELKEDIIAYMAKKPGKLVYAGAGWTRQNDLLPNADIDYAKELDKICADKPILMMDQDHHQAVANTKALTMVFAKAKINMTDKSKGREDTASVPGGVIMRLPDGRANGYLRDQATMYFMSELLNQSLTDDEFSFAVKDFQNTLYRQGYIYYNDALTNGMGDQGFMAMVKADKENRLKVVCQPNFSLSVFDLQDNDRIDKGTANIKTYHKYATKHVLPTNIKIFVDGVTEGQTGVNDIPYTGTQNYGNEILTEEKIYTITKAANKRGIGIHSHSYGNIAVHNTISAFIRAQKEVNNGTKNSMAHVRNVLDMDYKRMAENNIAVAENINWRIPFTESIKDYFNNMLSIPQSLQDGAYPVKSFVKNGVIVASSTDAPAANDAPTDVFGIMEIAVSIRALNCINGLPDYKKQIMLEIGLTPENMKNLVLTNENECVPVKQALDIMTINGAKLMGIDKERGSIEVGKYADFLLIDKNVLTCPADRIHEAKVTTVYFEGEPVYNNK